MLLLLPLPLLVVVARAAPTPNHRHMHVTLADGVTQVALWRHDRDQGVRFKCAHTRRDLAQDALRWLDTNADNTIDDAELHVPFDRCLGWTERMALRLGTTFGVAGDAATVMRLCDVDGDGRIGLADFVTTSDACWTHTDAELLDSHTHTTCLCTCTSIDQLYDFIFNREPC